MDGQRHYKMGYNISQNVNIDGVLLQLRERLKEEKNLPVNIIELGTYRGGLAFLIKDTFPEAEVVTFDPAPDCDMEQLAIDAKITTKRENIFEESITNQIKDTIQSKGLTIVFSDNGDKPAEFRLFSAFLKPGDIILSHDYAPNEAYFNANMRDKIWDWFQISDSDINDACVAHDLEDFMQEEFITAAWVCKRKKI